LGLNAFGGLALMDRSAMAPSPSASPGVIGRAAKAGSGDGNNNNKEEVDDDARNWIMMDLLDSSLLPEHMEGGGVWGTTFNPRADDDIVNTRIQHCRRVAFMSVGWM
jgi:hypothetical protein